MKDPAFLFYPQDFLVGTMTMSFEDKGKYITLLSAMHQHGKMNEETIRFLVGSISDSLRLKFKQDENGLWFNERLFSEIEKRGKFIESRTNNGKLGGRPKKEETYGKPKGKPTKNHSEDENENENVFEVFWDLYDKKIGEKGKIKKKFLKLSEGEIELIFAHIPKYKESQPDKKYRKNPETYLNNKSWNDEIIKQNAKTINHHDKLASNRQAAAELDAEIAEKSRNFVEQNKRAATAFTDIEP